MRLGALLLSVILLSSLLVAQQRYVVSSAGDMLPVPPGKSARAVINQQIKDKRIFNPSAACTPTQEYGNIPSQHTFNIRFVFGHQDVIAAWFESPADGHMDSVFVMPNNDTGGTDEGGNLLLRIFKSNITKSQGPGHPYLFGPGHYIAPPKVCWGYFNSTNDLDAHLAPYADDAMGPDTTWHSTYSLNNTTAASSGAVFPREPADTLMRSFPPMGDQLWGLTGIPVPIHPRTICGVDLTSLGSVPLNTGDCFFICFKVPGSHPVDPYPDVFSDPTRVEIQSSSLAPDGTDWQTDSNYSVRLQFTNWKFYEHPSFCGPGWLARGDVFIYIWYSMSVSSNIPPSFLYIDNLGSTTVETQDRTVTADIEDCDFATPDRAGVRDATLHYKTSSDNGASYNPTVDLAMINLGGSTYSADIPKLACPNTVKYWITSRDSDLNESSSLVYTYYVICLQNDYWVADTGTTATMGSIRDLPGTVTLDTLWSTVAPHRTWFEPRQITPTSTTQGTAPMDDGTAGPFNIGYFPYLGDTLHYAWIGVNGAIALSKTATDTINVNGSGYYSSFFIPMYQRKSMTDTSSSGGIPRNFIAGLWADLVYGDSIGKYGNIRYFNDDSKFVVEWDSIGAFDQVTKNSIADQTTFRIILHKDGGMVEVGYDDIGVNDVASNSVVGLMCDSLNANEVKGNIWTNLNSFPVECKPRNSWTVGFIPSMPTSVGDGWNMVSAPGRSVSYARTVLYPGASSLNAFAYVAGSGYVASAALSNGPGYWVKYAGAHAFKMPAGYLTNLAVPVTKFWNMIGSINKPVSTTDIINSAEPNTLIGSQFFEYNGGYNAVAILQPGKGYWVKTTDAGTIHMNASAAGHGKTAPAVDDMRKMNQITIASKSGKQQLYLTAQEALKHAVDYYDMPPTPPQGAFDARFATGRMVESYPAQGTATSEYTIEVHSTTFPVTVSWNIVSAPEGRTFTMSDADNGKVLGKVVLNGTGSIKIDANVKTLVLKAEAGINVPTRFDLSQNYPNPFNPTTRMQLSMPKTTNVTVAVYDVLGRQVATLLDGVQSAGYHTVEWNGQNASGMQVPSGTYFVRMMTDEFNTVKKIMMMK